MITAIVCDIEGTTTDIAFVHQVLFPFAAQRLPEFVRQHVDTPEVAAALKQLRQEAHEPHADLERCIALLQTYMQQDKKSPALKTLQGLIWVAGYHAKQFTGHVYADAYHALQQWYADGIQLYIYSSGSVAAQKLLFGHSDYGDLQPLFHGYFDTAVGAKREVNAYSTIRAQLQRPAHELLFLSDIHQELDAARADGWHTIQLIRGDADPDSRHPQVSSFADIQLSVLS